MVRVYFDQKSGEIITTCRGNDFPNWPATSYVEVDMAVSEMAVSPVDVSDPDNPKVSLKALPKSDMDVLKEEVDKVTKENLSALEAIAEVYELVMKG